MLLKADQVPGNYWISVHSQYRTGAPSGYAVLHYSKWAKDTLPRTPTPQPANVKPWSLGFINQVRVILSEGIVSRTVQRS